MSAHVVVPVKACVQAPAPTDSTCEYFLRTSGLCFGCLGDGTRAVITDAVPVERFPFNDETAPWREVNR